MNFPFTQEQKLFLVHTFGVDLKAELSDDEMLELEDRIAEHLQLHGINRAGDGENEIGTLCADILTIIAEYDV